MYSYMEYILKSFHKSTGWSEDNVYSHFTETSDNLIHFTIPKGFNITFSSQATENSFTSYTLSDLGFVSGSISYLYTSKPLVDIKTSSEISIRDAISGYKLLEPLKKQVDPMYWEVWQDGVRVDTKNTLLYGRMFLPGNGLEAMLVRRLSPTSQLLIKSVSDSRYKNNGAMTFTYQYNDGKWTSEYIYSTHEALLGLTGSYNFGAEERMKDPSITSRLSLGGEIFYAVLSKSPGLSTCLRYTAQSLYTGTPLTMSLLCNPLMGQISSTYSLSTRTLSLGSRFDFNIYSYESDLSIGWEFWRSFDNNGLPEGSCSNQEGTDGVLPGDASVDMTTASDSPISPSKDSAASDSKADTTKDDPKPSDIASKDLDRPRDHRHLPSEGPGSDLHASYSTLPPPPYTVTTEDGYFYRKYKRLLNTVDRTLYDTGIKSLINDGDPVVPSSVHVEEEYFQDSPVFCFKGNTSLSNQTVNLLWEGRFKELLVSSGFGLSFQTKVPSVTTVGVGIQYSA